MSTMFTSEDTLEAWNLPEIHSFSQDTAVYSILFCIFCTTNSCVVALVFLLLFLLFSLHSVYSCAVLHSCSLVVALVLVLVLLHGPGFTAYCVDGWKDIKPNWLNLTNGCYSTFSFFLNNAISYKCTALPNHFRCTAAFGLTHHRIEMHFYALCGSQVK